MQILPTLLWPATIFILLAVTLNYFVIKSDLTNIKKLISGFVNILMLITTSFMFTLMTVSSFKETVAFLKLNQVLLFVVFSCQLILSIIISLKITPFLDSLRSNQEKEKEESNAFWCLLIFLILSIIIFINYYS